MFVPDQFTSTAGPMAPDEVDYTMLFIGRKIQQHKQCQHLIPSEKLNPSVKSKDVSSDSFPSMHMIPVEMSTNL